MELRHVRYFLAVADSGSITKGAAAVRIAQPSLSRQLRQLEAEVGEALFDRSRGRARLTAAGEVFLPLARDLAGRADQAEALMQGLGEPGRLPLRLAAPETTVADVIAPYCDVAYFQASGPGGQHRNRTRSAVRLHHRPSGLVVIGRRQRSQHRNRIDALERLRDRIERLLRPDTPRVATKPSRAARARRLDQKKRRGSVKRLRGRVNPDD